MSTSLSNFLKNGPLKPPSINWVSLNSEKISFKYFFFFFFHSLLKIFNVKREQKYTFWVYMTSAIFRLKFAFFIPNFCFIVDKQTSMIFYWLLNFHESPLFLHSHIGYVDILKCFISKICIFFNFFYSHKIIIII